MRTRGGRLPDDTPFSPALDKARAELDEAEIQAHDVTHRLAADYDIPTTRRGSYRGDAPVQRRAEEIARELLRALPEDSVSELLEAWEAHDRLASVVRSFQQLCRGFTNMDRAGDAQPLTGFVDTQIQCRQDMLSDVDAVTKALAAAGICRATQNFPKAQLNEIQSRLEADVHRLESAGNEVASAWSSSEELSDPATVPARVAERLGDPDLRGALEAARARAGNTERFDSRLASFTRLVEQAGSAPNYALTRTGHHNLWSRGEYRRQLQDPDVVFHSESRLEYSRDQLAALLASAAASETPEVALGEALGGAFLHEVGLHAKETKDWAPTPEGVGEALAAEALVPFRALVETMDDARRGYPRGVPAMKAVVRDIIRSAVEGRYESWRTDNPASREQLAPLSVAQRRAWLSDHGESARDDHGRSLATREETGLELLWVTKIGGPSHGFDQGPHCLLPLLSNARTRPILVDRSDYPENAIARSYLRLLERP